jgi:hypothetical protein
MGQTPLGVVHFGKNSATPPTTDLTPEPAREWGEQVVGVRAFFHGVQCANRILASSRVCISRRARIGSNNNPRDPFSNELDFFDCARGDAG